MQTNVNPIPQGYHSVTPYLVVKDAKKAVEFYKNVFNAKELFKIDAPEGLIGHCELEIGDSRIMLADEMGSKSNGMPQSGGMNAFSLLIYVDNVDEVFNRAVKAGAKVLRELKNEFYGDRMGTIEDPFGHNWNLGMHIEDVSPEEMKRRADEMWQKREAH